MDSRASQFANAAGPMIFIPLPSVTFFIDERPPKVQSLISLTPSGRLISRIALHSWNTDLSMVLRDFGSFIV